MKNRFLAAESVAPFVPTGAADPGIRELTEEELDMVAGGQGLAALAKAAFELVKEAAEKKLVEKALDLAVDAIKSKFQEVSKKVAEQLAQAGTLTPM